MVCAQLSRFLAGGGKLDGGRNKQLCHVGLRVGEDVVDVALLHHAAGLHDSHTVSDAGDHVHLVGNHDDGHAQFTVHTLKERKHFLSGFRVQRAGGLISQQQGRVGRKRTSNTHTLLLTARQIPRTSGCLIVKADQF